MPEATQTEVGRRLYHVHREKAVERAVKLMQHGIGTGWKALSEEDILLLSHLLQCTWNVIEQKCWDKIPFANIKMNEIKTILTLGDGVAPGRNPDRECVDRIQKILLGLS